ncbi:hypothetical protein BAGA_14690, partial [Bacillus gaemokensis]
MSARPSTGCWPRAGASRRRGPTHDYPGIPFPAAAVRFHARGPADRRRGGGADGDPLVPAGPEGPGADGRRHFPRGAAGRGARLRRRDSAGGRRGRGRPGLRPGDRLHPGAQPPQAGHDHGR